MCSHRNKGGIGNEQDTYSNNALCLMGTPGFIALSGNVREVVVIFTQFHN
jgi:hypothetical protein